MLEGTYFLIYLFVFFLSTYRRIDFSLLNDCGALELYHDETVFMIGALLYFENVVLI